MEVHYQILDNAFENPDGGESPEFFVDIREDSFEVDDQNHFEYFMALCINAPMCDLVINYTAQAPTLVNVGGTFSHYWDFGFASASITELYDEDGEEKLDESLEDNVIEIIAASAK